MNLVMHILAFVVFISVALALPLREDSEFESMADLAPLFFVRAARAAKAEEGVGMSNLKRLSEKLVESMTGIMKRSTASKTRSRRDVKAAKDVIDAADFGVVAAGETEVAEPLQIQLETKRGARDVKAEDEVHVAADVGAEAAGVQTETKLAAPLHSLLKHVVKTIRAKRLFVNKPKPQDFVITKRGERDVNTQKDAELEAPADQVEGDDEMQEDAEAEAPFHIQLKTKRGKRAVKAGNEVEVETADQGVEASMVNAVPQLMQLKAKTGSKRHAREAAFARMVAEISAPLSASVNHRVMVKRETPSMIKRAVKKFKQFTQAVGQKLGLMSIRKDRSHKKSQRSVKASFGKGVPLEAMKKLNLKAVKVNN